MGVQKYFWKFEVVGEQFFVFKHWKFRGGGINVKFPPHVVGVWILSGTTQ